MQALMNQSLCILVDPKTKKYGLNMHRQLQTDLVAHFNFNEEQLIQITDKLLTPLNDLFPI